MNCKECGRPVERAIEGELICEDCWTKGQMSEEELAFDEAVNWFRTHCAQCEKEFKPGKLIDGYCKKCYNDIRSSVF